MEGNDPADPAELADLPLFAELDAEELDRAASLLTAADLPTDAVLVAEGRSGGHLVLLGEGSAEVELPDSHETVSIEAGAVIGEMAILDDAPASATVRATSAVHVFFCDADELDELLELPGVHERLRVLSKDRHADNWSRVAEPIPFTLADGTSLTLRPIRRDDAAAIERFDAELSPESRRRRFLGAATLTPSMLDYLINVDHERHFAWVAETAATPPRLVGVARFIRLREDPASAEFAIVVADDLAGRGLGRFLFDALGVAARERGVTTFVAYILWENTAMRSIVNHFDPDVRPDEPGTMYATCAAPDLEPGPIRGAIVCLVSR